MSAAYPFDLTEVSKLIGCHAQNAVLLQCSGDCIQKIARENPALLMPALRPRIRKQKIKIFHRIFRQQVPHCKQSVRTEHSHVIDLLRFMSNFLYALGQPLNSEEISFRQLLRKLAEKGTIATAKIDLQGRAASEKLHKIEARDMQFRHQFDHPEKCRLPINAATFAVY